MVDLNTVAVQAAADALTNNGRQAIAISCDVRDEDQVAAAVADTVQHFGSLDLAFNNAGIQIPYAGIADESADDFDRVNAVNYRASGRS